MMGNKSGSDLAMQLRAFGKTNWRVGQIGLGCWQFGGAITLDGQPDGWSNIRDEDSTAAIHRAIDLGVTFFDTADMYGWGHSEEILGAALKSHSFGPSLRDKVVIATKVGFWHDATGRRTYNETCDYIVRACEASLRRLQTDRIDLYQCHLWRTERWHEFLKAFDILQQQGKIRCFGVSTNDFEMVQRFDETGKLASVQANYNLLDRRAESDIMPYCRARGIAFIARGPLATGKLSGKYATDSALDADDIRSVKWLSPGNRAAFERDIAVVDRLRPIAAKAGFTMPQLAIKFVLSHMAVSVVIPGARNAQQVEENVAASILPPFGSDEYAAIEKALTER
jgi:myo-inositol catabolism protein IolS